jgi:tripartite-type tricarboxylate transporter receptor subunit TctC
MKAVTFTAILSLGAGLFGATSAAHAASIDFSGKTVEVLVGFSPGGGYDAYARALARYLGPNMPGSPQVVVKNMPGAGSMKLALYLVGVAPKDGTSIGTFDPNLITAPLLDPQNAKFDASKFSWVGSIAEGTNVCISWHTSPVKTVDDLISKQAPFGATGRDDARYMDAAIMRNMFGSKLQIITGYQGSSDVRLAMERGEIAGNCGDSWASLKTTAADWIRDKKIHVLAQYALEKHPEIALCRAALCRAARRRHRCAGRAAHVVQRDHERSGVRRLRPEGQPRGEPGDGAAGRRPGQRGVQVTARGHRCGQGGNPVSIKKGPYRPFFKAPADSG